MAAAKPNILILMTDLAPSALPAYGNRILDPMIAEIGLHYPGG